MKTEYLKHYFKTYTESNETHATSDGLLFHRSTDASAHAATLADKNVKKYTREEVEKMEDEPTSEETGEPQGQGENPEGKKAKGKKKPEEQKPEGK